MVPCKSVYIYVCMNICIYEYVYAFFSGSSLLVPIIYLFMYIYTWMRGCSPAYKDMPLLIQIPLSTWNQVMDEVAREYPTILHFGLHAQVDSVKLFDEIEQLQRMISAIQKHNDFARANVKAEIQVIILNTCESDEHAHKLSACVDFAIGRKGSVAVGDERAIDFTYSFYDNIFRGMNLAGSFSVARSVSSKGYQLHAKKDPCGFFLAYEDAGQRSDLGPAGTMSEKGVSSHARGRGGSAETEGRVSTAANAMMSLLDEIKAKSANIVLLLIDHTSDHFDLMISYRVNTEKVTALRMYDKIMLTPNPDLAQMGDRRSKIPAYARASRHASDLDPGIARTFLDQKHIPQGVRWEKVFVNAVTNSLVLVPLLSWYEEDGKEPSGSVGELMSLHHSDRVDNFLLEMMIGNVLMKLPAGSRWLQRISPIFIGTPDARGYTEFPFANIDKLPDVPSLKTCKRAAEILLDELKIPVDTTVMAFSVRQHINNLLKFQGVKLSDLGHEDIALQSASKRLVQQIPGLQPTRLIEIRKSEVREFRYDMANLIRDFLASSKQRREWRLCELLLVAFMRNMIAPSCKDSNALGEIKFWQGKCNTPSTNLVQYFHEMLINLDPKPAIFTEIMDKYKVAVAGKKNDLSFLSVGAIDWMVQHSAWALRGKSLIRNWRNEVVMQWFDSGSTEASDIFLERAETFLC